MNKKNYLLKEFNSKKCYKTHLIQNLYIKNNIVLKSVTNYVQLLLKILFLDRDVSPSKLRPSTFCPTLTNVGIVSVDILSIDILSVDVLSVDIMSVDIMSAHPNKVVSCSSNP